MKFVLLTLFWRKLLVVLPNYVAFGHLGLELKMVLAMARDENALVYLITHPESVNPVYYQIASPEVTILRGPAWFDGFARKWLLAWLERQARARQSRQERHVRLREMYRARRREGLPPRFASFVRFERSVHAWRSKRRDTARFRRKERIKWAKEKIFRPIRKRKRLRRWLDIKKVEAFCFEKLLPARPRLAEPPVGEYFLVGVLRKLGADPEDEKLDKWAASKRTGYLNRRAIAERIPVTLRPAEKRRLGLAAERLGLPLEGRFVVFHARESGFKLGREAHDKASGNRMGVRRDDDVRNMDPSCAFDALRFLVDQGFTVIRVGDPSMQPIEMRGIVDLATMEDVPRGLDIFYADRCEFIVAAESGAFVLGWVFDKPALVINGTDIFSSYPIRAFDRILMKRVYRKDDGSALSLWDMIGQEYVENLRNTLLYEYSDNTPEEILAATQEFYSVATGADESPIQPEQEEFRRKLVEAGQELSKGNGYIRKWSGHDLAFAGEGAVSQVQLDLLVARPAPSEGVRVGSGL